MGHKAFWVSGWRHLAARKYKGVKELSTEQREVVQPHSLYLLSASKEV